MLGGADAIDGRSTGEAIVDGYREAGIGGTLHDKVENFVAMAGGGPAAEKLAEAARAVAAVRRVFFYRLLPSLGLLIVAPFAMLVA